MVDSTVLGPSPKYTCRLSDWNVKEPKIEVTCRIEKVSVGMGTSWSLVTVVNLDEG